MQNHRTVVVAAVVAVAAAVALGTAVGLSLGGEPSSTGSSPRSSTGARAAGATNAPAGSPSDSADSRPGTTTGSAGPSGSATSGAGDRGGVETLPEAPGVAPSGLPGLTEPDHVGAPPPAWDGAATTPVAARGHLVTGYPVQLLPATPRATILSSSLSPSAGQVQLALVARRGQSPAAVLHFYRARLARVGFEEHAVRSVGGATAAAFTRDDNRVVVTVDPGPAQTYSVQATLVSGQA